MRCKRFQEQPGQVLKAECENRRGLTRIHILVCVCLAGALKREKLVKIRSFSESTVASVWNKKRGDTMLLASCYAAESAERGIVGGKRHRSLATWLVCGVSRGAAQSTLHSVGKFRWRQDSAMALLMVPYGATQRMATSILSLSAWLSRNNGKLY